MGVRGVTSTARSAVRASGEGRASVRAWTHTWERGAASTVDLSSPLLPVSPSWRGGGGHIDRALCRARERGGKGERVRLDEYLAGKSGVGLLLALAGLAGTALLRGGGSVT